MSIHPVLLSLAFLVALAPADAKITTETLLEEMVNLDRLSQLPDPAFKVVQFSSYDRKSTAPYAPDWYANSDGFGGEPIPNFLEVIEEPNSEGVGKYLLASVEGPGGVVRCWTAKTSGELEVYLDGSSAPIYKGEAETFLQKTLPALATAGGVVEFEKNRRFNQREAHYFPILFQKSLRVVWIGNLKEIHFYQLEVRKYPEGTSVQTYSAKDLETYSKVIDRVGVALRGTAADAQAAGRTEISKVVNLAPGESREILNREGSQVVRALRLKLSGAPEANPLRKIILTGFFDGSHRPQIETPVGDFFGSSPLLTPYYSFPMQVEDTGWMTSRFPMPWKERGVLVLTNRSDQPASVECRIAVEPAAWDDDRSLHFHAKWRVDHDLVAGEDAGVFDLPYLSARGTGVYVGTALSVLNPSSVPTSGGNWWGEGDEKVWVDDDSFPSLFGTGSEDYFNYAWSSPELFQHPYFAQPYVTGPDNRGFNTNLRWHILDPLPFQERIDFYMELFTHTRTEGISYARVAYYYARPNLRDDFTPITGLDLKKGLKLPENWTPVARGQAEGALFFQAEDLKYSGEGVRIESAPHWAGGKVLRWDPAQEGDQLKIEFEISEAGKFQPVVTFLENVSGGKVSIQLDDVALEPAAALFTKYREMSRNTWLEAEGGHRELSAGKHTLTLTSEGTLKGSLGDEVGIDFIWLKPR